MSAAAIIDWALQTGLAVSALIILVLLIRRPFAKIFGAGATYALWLLPAIRLIMPDITLPAFGKRFPDIVPSFRPVQPDTTIGLAPETMAQTTATLNPWPMIIGLWLGVAVIWFIWQILQQRNFMQKLKVETSPAPAGLSGAIFKAMKELNLKKRPAIRLAQDASGPMVTGVGRPLIILPETFTTAFTPAQQHFALVHEMAHIKRRDLWVALGVLAFRALNWPNPLIHYAAHKFRADQEAACDAYVLGKIGGGDETTHSYAETLIHAAKSGTSRAKAPLGLALMDTDNSKGDEI